MVIVGIGIAGIALLNTYMHRCKFAGGIRQGKQPTRHRQSAGQLPASHPGAEPRSSSSLLAALSKSFCCACVGAQLAPAHADVAPACLCGAQLLVELEHTQAGAHPPQLAHILGTLLH